MRNGAAPLKEIVVSEIVSVYSLRSYIDILVPETVTSSRLTNRPTCCCLESWTDRLTKGVIALGVLSRYHRDIAYVISR